MHYAMGGTVRDCRCHGPRDRGAGRRRSGSARRSTRSSSRKAAPPACALTTARPPRRGRRLERRLRATPTAACCATSASAGPTAQLDRRAGRWASSSGISAPRAPAGCGPMSATTPSSSGRATKASSSDIFRKGKLAEDMSLYVHRPSVTDPTAAPAGDDSLLRPRAGPASRLRRRAGLGRPGRALPPAGRRHPRDETPACRRMSPRAWSSPPTTSATATYHSRHGCGFSIEPRILQAPLPPAQRLRGGARPLSRRSGHSIPAPACPASSPPPRSSPGWCRTRPVDRRAPR